MAKVIGICGKISSGKSIYAEQLRIQNKAAVLSVDEVMLALFEQNIGDKRDEYVEKTQKYLFEKSIELIEAGIGVILDWGFWTRAERAFVREFYTSRGIDFELHYIDISDEEWKTRLNKRNSAVLANETNAYFVDESLAAKFSNIFEKPDESEVDMWVKQ